MVILTPYKYEYNYSEMMLPRNLYRDIEYLVTISSALNNTDRRNSIRETWAKALQVIYLGNVQIVFVIGCTDSRNNRKL